jgi:hypothetical protein
VDLSGVIFVVLALVWAVYLIPKALKQDDEVARTRSIDGFSSAMRVVARREPVNRRDARLVVPRHPEQPARPAAPPTAVGRQPSAPRAETRRTATRVAARRRRRILAFLLLCVVATGAAAYLGHLPPGSAAVPGGLTLAFLVLCRTQVRRDRRALARRSARRVAAAPAAGAAEQPVEQSVVEARVGGPVPEQQTQHEWPQPRSEPEPRIEVAAAREPEPELAPPPGVSGTLWDPLPVTLPTYVTKAKARRTVRTIDLGEPGTWTSGRTPEDAEIAAQATDEPAAEDGSTRGGRRAVGT